MMRRIFPLCIAALFSASLFAQSGTCPPDPNTPDTLVGVFPLPYDPATNPDGGIRDTACLNVPFQFVFTAVVNETISFGGNMIPLDSIRLPVTGGIINLPTGMTYACDPPDCVFEANTKGCVVIYGTTTDPSQLGDHSLGITAQAFTTGGFSITIQFPGTFFPGTYNLNVQNSDFGNCVNASAADILKDLVELKNVPNPFSGTTEIIAKTAVGGNFDFSVSDLTGKILHIEKIKIQRGENRIFFDGSDLPNGFFIYKLSNELGAVSGKMCVSGN